MGRENTLHYLCWAVDGHPHVRTMKLLATACAASVLAWLLPLPPLQLRVRVAMPFFGRFSDVIFPVRQQAILDIGAVGVAFSVPNPCKSLSISTQSLNSPGASPEKLCGAPTGLPTPHLELGFQALLYPLDLRGVQLHRHDRCY